MQVLNFAAVAFASVLVAWGAQTVNFSGTWKMDATRSESAHQAVPIGPVTLVIVQSDRELRIDTQRQATTTSTAQSEVVRYPLDVTETAAGAAAGNSNAAGEPVKAKAHWEGNHLVTETERNIQDSTVTTLNVLSLSPDGKELTLDRTLTVQHGYQSPGAKNTGRGKDVFVKVKRSNETVR